VVWKQHVHFFVFEAWLTNSQSHIIGCYECLSNAPVRLSNSSVLPPRSVIGYLSQRKIWLMGNPGYHKATYQLTKPCSTVAILLLFYCLT